MADIIAHRRSDLLVLAALGRAAEPLGAREVARRAGLGAWRARWSLRRLRRLGLVRREAEGYRVTEEGARRGGLAFITQVLADVTPDPPVGVGLVLWRRLGTVRDPSVFGPAYEVGERAGSVAGLRELAASGGLDQRTLAVRALGRLRAPDAVAPLTEVLGGAPDESLRAEAAIALGRVATEDAVTALRGALGRGSSVLREAVADALGITGDRASRDALAAMTSDASAPVRAGAVRALGRLGDAAGVAALAPRLADADDEVRREARRALVMTGTPEAVRALRQNPLRLWPLRVLDVARARAAVRHGASRAGGGPVRVMPVRAKGLARSGKLLALAMTLLAAEVFVVKANLVLLGVATPVAASLLARLASRAAARRPYGAIDEIHARLEPWPRDVLPVPSRSTAATVVVERPLLSAGLVLGPLAVDALTGGIGIAGAIAAALLLAAAFSAALDRAAVARYEAARQATVWTEAPPSPLPARRFFVIRSRP